MRRLLHLALISSAVLALTSETAQAQCVTAGNGNLVANCSFEIVENNPVAVVNGWRFLNPNQLSNWTVSPSGRLFEQWMSGPGGVFPAQHGSSHLELDADAGGNSTVSQVLTTVFGQYYVVNFWIAHRSFNAQTSSVEALWQDGSNLTNLTTATVMLVAGPLSDPDQYRWRQYTTGFTALSAQTVIGFRGAGPSNTHGDHLDNISVTAVPEPSTYALMGAGLLTIGAFSRRRRRV